MKTIQRGKKLEKKYFDVAPLNNAGFSAAR